MIMFSPQPNGIYPGFWSFGVLVFSMTVLVPSLKILTFSYSYYFMNIFALTMSMILFLLTFVALNEFATNEHYQLFAQ